jgi:hypothetical protein
MHIRGRKKSTDIALIWGFLVGVLVCLVDYFFVFRDPMVHTSIVIRALSEIIFTVIIPQAELFLPFALICRDNRHYKAGCFFPLMASFYAIFIPYRVLNTPLLPGSFELLFLPLIYLLLIFAEGLCFKKLVANRR